MVAQERQRRRWNGNVAAGTTIVLTGTPRSSRILQRGGAHDLLLRDVMRARREPAPIEPELGDHVIVPRCAILGGKVAVVVGFHRGRAVVRSESNPNVTVALSNKQEVLPEHCREHADCLANAELAVACAQADRAARLAHHR